MDIFRLTGDNLKEAAKKAAQVLAKGGVVAYPTDTLYGLAVNALDTDAIERLRQVKGRERKRPISIVLPSVSHIDSWGHLNEKARALAEKHFPGALTLVIPAHERIPEELTLNGALGIRIPDDAFCLALAEAFGYPYTATSANKSGISTPASAEELIWHFGADIAKIDLIIDAGERDNANASTVVLCIDDTPRILRHGAIRADELDIEPPPSA